ncbi:hypothetical protein GMI69_00210 [Eggerthellaceae bacterium zg-887]|uniref:hypothetical protein n=1 Tax=Xiamenia xianingshaonis TaxID=2682776 RepID=UPI00140B6BEA|nr:hypothetical protein [Xiamenia xianingshaonis]NHM15101.1 hypothetical protein [Xiamenia xianingshaonis]
MLNLLKSDVYRLVHGKKLWVGAAVVVVMALAVAGMAWWIATPQFADMVNASIGQPDGADLAVSGDEPAAPLNEAVMDNFTHTVDQVLVGTGILTVLVSVLAGRVVLDDFSSRFVQSVFTVRRSRWDYYAEKLLLAAMLAAAFTLLADGAVAAAFALFGFSYDVVQPIGEIALWTVLVWLVTTAFTWLSCVVAWLTRSKGALDAWAVLVSTTFLGSMVQFLCTTFGVGVPLLENLPNFLLSNCVVLLSTQGLGLVETYPLLLAPSVGIAGWVSIVSALWLVAAAAVTFVACRRKDA